MTYLYAATCGEYVKIGISARPFERARAVFYPGLSTTIVPDGIRGQEPESIIAIVGTVQDERNIHLDLGRHRRIGEWFSVSVKSDPVFMSAFAETNLVDRESLRYKSSLTLVSVDGEVHLEAKKVALDRGETLATLATRALQREITRLRKSA